MQAWLGRRVIFNAAVPETKPAAPDVRPDRPPEIGLIGSETQGSMAEKFVVPAANILDVGDADPINAAAFALTFLTAWRMISTRARLRPDQTVLITGIGGGVALAALQIARYIGSKVIVTSRHQWKLDTALGLGAHTASSTAGRTGRRRSAHSPADAAWISAWTRWARPCTRGASRAWLRAES